MKTGEGHHVNCQLPQVSIELSRETQTSGNTRHGQGHQMVQVTIGGCGELQSTEADVIESLVVNAEGLISVLDKLVHREGSIVGLHNSV